MRLTNDQIYALGNAGFGKVNYTALDPENALKVYCLRKAIGAAFRDIDATRQDIIKDAFGDELLARVAQYEQKGTGMTEAEYQAAVAERMPKADAIIRSMGAESRDIDVEPIAFDAWLLLAKDNAFLCGCEDILDAFIATK